MSAITTLKAIDRFLLPQRPEFGMLPYAWLVYVGWLVVPLFIGAVSTTVSLLTLLSLAVFLPLYFLSFRLSDLTILPVTMLYLLMAFSLAPSNFGSSVYVVYACACAANFTKLKHGVLLLACLLLCTIVVSFSAKLPVEFLIGSLLFGGIIGLVTLHSEQIRRKNEVISRSEKEIKQLATTAERERIARDLHDLMGHTFSMITVKAQLVSRLIDIDPERAKGEVGDIEAASRKALSEVRQTVANYTLRTFEQELVEADKLLKAAGFNYALPDTVQKYGPEIDRVLALTLRESVNNCLKHADIQTCQVNLTHDTESVDLTITNPGCYSKAIKGNGLKGIASRIETIGGTFIVNCKDGFDVHIRLPLKTQ